MCALERACTLHVFLCENLGDVCTAMQSQDGRTALDCARSWGKDEVVKLLNKAPELKKAAEERKAAEAKWICESCEVRGSAVVMLPRHCIFDLSPHSYACNTADIRSVCHCRCCIFPVSGSQLQNLDEQSLWALPCASQGASTAIFPK